MDTGSTSTDNWIESLTNTLTLLNPIIQEHNFPPKRTINSELSSNARNNATVQECKSCCSGCFEADHIAMQFDSDVDEAPTTQTMFMVNLSSEDPIYDEAGPSYDSNTPFEVQDHDTFVDHMDEYHEGPQKPEISNSDDNSTEHSTCQSNDSEGSFGNPSDHSSESESESISVSNEMFASKSVTTNEKVVSESKEVEPSCATQVKSPRQQMKNQRTPEVKGKNWNKIMERELGEGYSFIKKRCFVCGSLSHLIKDCDFYEKKMAREAALKKQRVFITGNGVAKPVWTNANRVNHANQFVPRSLIR
ncbi:hypothetical protein Tco_0491833 [Tanacetum coccineum]